MTSIAVIDYGMGNLRSVEKALERIGSRGVVTNDHARIRECDGAILPGVGAFPRAMEQIADLGLDELLQERLAAGMPLLGICLGLQLLFQSSVEKEGGEGLGFLRGEVRPLEASGQKVPLIGWCPVRWERGSRLNEGLEDEVPFYFVHSFTPAPRDPEDVLGMASYGERFVCAVERELLFGVQFHPEKSSSAGLRLLSNFTAVCATVATVA